MATYRRVPIENCIVDPRYQREIKPRHPALVDEFDAALLGTLEGSERGNGKVAIFDGQHRLERLRREQQDGGAWSGSTTAPVMVHTGLAPEQEADLFRRLQEGRQALRPEETFRARLFAEDPVAVSMDGIARAKGFHIATGPGSLQAVVAVERVFHRGNLEETLEFLALWAGEKRALESGMIDGLSRFLELYPEADRGRVKEILADTSPVVVWRRTVEVMEVARSSRARAVLEVIRSLISSRKHPLPTVASALEQRVESSRGRSYRRRVTLEQVRDAARELGSFYPEQLAEKLGISPRSLTKQGGVIEQLMNRSVPAIARHRAGTKGQGGGGRYYYEYLRPQPGIPAAKRVKAPPPEVMAAQRATGNGAVPHGHVPRVSDPAVQEVVNELFALGVRMEQGGSYLKAFPPQGGGRPISISKSSTGGRAKTLRGKLRRAGINVKR